MSGFLETVQGKLELVDRYVWHPYFMVAIVVATGLYVTLRFLLPQVRFLVHAMGLASGRYDRPEHEGELTHRDALCAALAGTVGVGNIAGVATAIHLGGPGAVFWLWVGGFLAMATKMAESSLAVRYRETLPDGTVAGGPMYTMRNALGGGWRWLAYVFAAACALAALLGIGNTVQSNTIAIQVNDVLGIPRWVVGIAVSALVAAVILGGIRRIGRVASIVVPAMAALYLVAAVVVIAMNVESVPAAIGLIFRSAFNPTAATGGFIGVGVASAIRFGIARGALSSEAGQGSSPIAHAAARSDPPIRQGFVALLEPFVDTIVICTLTAMVIVSTGAWQRKTKGDIELAAVRVFDRTIETSGEAEGGSYLLTGAVPFRDGVNASTFVAFHERSVVEAPRILLGGKPFTGTIDFKKGKLTSAQMPRTDEKTPPGLQPRKRYLTKGEVDDLEIRGYFCQTGAVLSSQAFEHSLGFWGKIVIVIAVLLFGYSTSIAWSYYGDRAVAFLLGARAVLPYRILFVFMNFLGAILTLDIVWTIADILNALMILPNVVSIWLLAGVVGHMVKSYSVRKGGIDVTVAQAAGGPVRRKRKG